MRHVDFAAVQAGVFAQISADPEIKALIGTGSMKMRGIFLI